MCTIIKEAFRTVFRVPIYFTVRQLARSRNFIIWELLQGLENQMTFMIRYFRALCYFIFYQYKDQAKLYTLDI